MTNFGIALSILQNYAARRKEKASLLYVAKRIRLSKGSTDKAK